MGRSRPAVNYKADTVFAVFSLLLLQDGLKLSHTLKLLFAGLRRWTSDLLLISNLASALS